MYLHKTKNGHYTPPCCYFSGELEVVECLPQTFSCGMMVTATQKIILDAFGLNEGNVRYQAKEIGNVLQNQ